MFSGERPHPFWTLKVFRELRQRQLRCVTCCFDRLVCAVDVIVMPYDNPICVDVFHDVPLVDGPEGPLMFTVYATSR